MSSNDDITEALDAIEDRLGNATEGPWKVWENLHCDPVVIPEGKGRWEAICDVSNSPADYGRGNLHFIAHARQDIPWLIATLRDALKAAQ